MNVAVFGQTEMSPVTCVLEGSDALRKIDLWGGSFRRSRRGSSTPWARFPTGRSARSSRPQLMAGYWQEPDGHRRRCLRRRLVPFRDLVRRDEEGGFIYVVDQART